MWSEKNFGEQWWIGLIGLTSNRLYLHGFRKPDMPEQKNIIAVDLKTGEILWKNTECSFLSINSPLLYGYKDLFERRVYYSIDELTGSVIEELKELPTGVGSNVQYERTDFHFPEPTGAEHEAAWDIAFKTEGFKSAEHISFGHFIILNVYSQNNDPSLGLKNTLSVIDTATKKKVYSDVLNASTQYPVPDSFFMDGDRIYYINERKTLIAVELKS